MAEITLRTKRATRVIHADQHERLLYAALRAGLELPHECATGNCGSCQAELVSGAAPEDAWPHAPGRRHMREGGGRVLLCQSLCAGSVELRLFGALGELSETTPRPDYVQASLQSVSALTADVLLFVVRAQQAIRYRAGQFMVLQVPGIDGWRAYSMIDAPAEGQELRFVVKKLPGGAFSNWIGERAEPGLPLRLFGPLGRASFNTSMEDTASGYAQGDTDLVAIAGGTGIAGILSVVDAALASGHFRKHRARIFFGVRKLPDAFLMERLCRIVEQGDGCAEATLVLSEQSSTEPALPAFPGIRFASGLVHAVAMHQLRLAPPANGTAFFLAGPSVLIDAARQSLTAQMAVKAQQIRCDSFG